MDATSSVFLLKEAKSINQIFVPENVDDCVGL